MLKTGDVLVVDEEKLRELMLGGVLEDVRRGKTIAKKATEDAGRHHAVIRVEKLGRATPREPAFNCDFDDEVAPTPSGEGG